MSLRLCRLAEILEDPDCNGLEDWLESLSVEEFSRVVAITLSFGGGHE